MKPPKRTFVVLVPICGSFAIEVKAVDPTEAKKLAWRAFAREGVRSGILRDAEGLVTRVRRVKPRLQLVKP